MDFDTMTFVILRRPPGAPTLTPEQELALQDEHLAFTADMHEAGHLVAAGPVGGQPDPSVRGFAIYRLPQEEVAEMVLRDPAVAAGRFTPEVMTWSVPAGLVSFAPGRVPRSVAEAAAE